jgi:hypothetical protein
VVKGFATVFLPPPAVGFKDIKGGLRVNLVYTPCRVFCDIKKKYKKQRFFLTLS